MRAPIFGAEAIAKAKDRLGKAGVRSQLMVDCSHGNSNKDYTQQAGAFKDVVSQRISGDSDVIGAMLESNLNEGNQRLCEDLSQLQYGVSITDACIGWGETEELLIGPTKPWVSLSPLPSSHVSTLRLQKPPGLPIPRRFAFPQPPFNPDLAKCDGPQSLTFENFALLMD